MPSILQRMPETPDRGPRIVNNAIALLVGAAACTAMRLSRRWRRHGLSWEDAAVSVAVLFSILQTTAACLSERHGYGRPVKSLNAEELRGALFWFFIAQIAYKGTIWPAKLSLLLLYRRVFSDTPQVTVFGINFRTSLKIMVTFVITFFFVSEIVTTLTCVPVMRYWDRVIPGKCSIDTLAWWFSQSILNTMADFVILILPMPLVMNLLQIPKQQKYGLMLVFALGLFVTVCTIIRMTTFKTGTAGVDTTYDGAVTLILSLIESNIAIICANLPLFRPFLARLIPGFKNKSNSSRRPSYSFAKQSARRGSEHIHDGTGTGSNWSEWKEGNNVTISNPASQRRGSAESELGLKKSQPDPCGITKQMDVEVVTEAASVAGAEGLSKPPSVMKFILK